MLRKKNYKVITTGIECVDKKFIKIDKGAFTLVELVVVIVIFAILVAIAVPSFIRYTGRAKEKVCNSNSSQLKRIYDTYLILGDIEHTDALFFQYLDEFGQDICPEDVVISYVGGKVQCSVHTFGGDVDNGEEDGSVLFL